MQANALPAYMFMLCQLCLAALVFIGSLTASEIQNASAIWAKSQQADIRTDSKALTKLSDTAGRSGKPGKLVQAFLAAQIAEIASSTTIDGKTPYLEARYKIRKAQAVAIADLASKLFIEIPAGLSDDAELISQCALWMAQAGRLDEAIAMIDLCGQRADEMNRVTYAICLSKLRAAQTRWEEAVRMAGRAVDLSNALYEGGQLDAVNMMRLRAKKNHSYMVRIQDIAIHGLGFRLYYEANIQRMQLRKFDDAIAQYRQLLKLSVENISSSASVDIVWMDPEDLMCLPIHPIYAAAARFGILSCLYAQQSLDDPKFKKEVSEIIGEYDTPFFPSNALFVADVALWRGRIDEATVHLNRVVAWINEPACKPIYEIPQQSFERVKPPDTMHSVAEFGRIEWFAPKPNELYTPLNSKWWSDYVSLQAKRRLAMLAFMAGDRGKATRLLDEAMPLDAADMALIKEGRPSNYMRLKEGVKIGRFFATQQELALFPQPAIPILLSAEWKFECEEWASAIIDYERLAQTSGLSKEAKAYIQYAMACANIYLKKIDVSASLLADFDPKGGKYIGTPTFGRAVFAMATTQKGPKEAIDILKTCQPLLKSQEEQFETSIRIGQSYLSLQDTKSARGAFRAANNYAGSDDMRKQVINGFLKMCDDIDTMPRIETQAPKKER